MNGRVVGDVSELGYGFPISAANPLSTYAVPSLLSVGGSLLDF